MQAADLSLTRRRVAKNDVTNALFSRAAAGDGGREQVGAGSKRGVWISAAIVLAIFAGVAVAIWGAGVSRNVGGVVDHRLPAAAGAQPKQATAIRPLSGPWVVAVQPGHWQIAELPQELWRLRTNTGAQWGDVREVDINRAVSSDLISMITAQGWKPVLVPATVPPELRADAFVAVHADSSSDTSRHGWKLSSPWRSSQASRELAKAVAGSFAQEPQLVEDVDGITVNMRGYFAFNDRRFVHAIGPYTPAIIIELGFISNAADRARLTSDPHYYAGLIMRGLEAYFKGRNRSETADLAPMQLPWVMAGPQGVVVRRSPSTDSEALWRIDPGTIMMPVDASGDWYEVFVRHHFATGWILKSGVVDTADPHWPMPGEAGSANVR